MGIKIIKLQTLLDSIGEIKTKDILSQFKSLPDYSTSNQYESYDYEVKVLANYSCRYLVDSNKGSMIFSVVTQMEDNTKYLFL